MATDYKIEKVCDNCSAVHDVKATTRVTYSRAMPTEPDGSLRAVRIEVELCPVCADGMARHLPLPMTSPRTVKLICN